MALPSYSTGTATVDAGGTNVALTDATTAFNNVFAGDTFCIGTASAKVVDVVDDENFTITPWPGSAETDAVYTLLQDSALRFTDVEIAIDLKKQVQFLNAQGYEIPVPDDMDEPDPTWGDDGQKAIKFGVTPWKVWLKEEGVWVLQPGSPGGQGDPGATWVTQAAEPATDYPANSLWLDSDSADLDVYELSGSPLAWTDTGINLKGAAGPTGAGVPVGGSSGQVLSKTDGTDFNTEWIDPPASLPSGGTTGQVLTKASSTDGDADWVDQSGTKYGSIQGLNTANNATDSTNDIDIAIGSARDTTNTYDLSLSAGITKRLDAAWAAGTNQGGLDSGSKANSTTYHIFLIRKDSDGSIDAIFSTSPTNPSMPTGYSKKRRIASIKTNSSGVINPYTQNGGFFTLKSPIQQNANSLTTTPTLVTATDLPVGIKVRATLLFATAVSSFVAVGWSLVRDPDLGVPSTTITGIEGTLLQISADIASAWIDVWSSAAGQFYMSTGVTNFSASFFVVKGWFDLRDEYQ